MRARTAQLSPGEITAAALRHLQTSLKRTEGMSLLRSALLVVLLAAGAASVSAAATLPEALKSFPDLSELAGLLEKVRERARSAWRGGNGLVFASCRRCHRRVTRCTQGRPSLWTLQPTPARLKLLCRTPARMWARASRARCWRPPTRQGCGGVQGASFRLAGSWWQVATAAGTICSLHNNPHDQQRASKQHAQQPHPHHPAPLPPPPALLLMPSCRLAPQRLQAFKTLRAAAKEEGVRLNADTTLQILVRRITLESVCCMELPTALARTSLLLMLGTASCLHCCRGPWALFVCMHIHLHRSWATRVQLYHVLPTSYKLADLADGTSVPTSQGSPVEVK